MPEYMSFCMLEATGAQGDGFYWGSYPNSQYDYLAVQIIFKNNKKIRYISPCIYSYFNKERYYALAPKGLTTGAQNNVIPVFADTISAFNLQYAKETISCTLYYR